MGLYNLYSLPNYSGDRIKKHEMEGHIACMGEGGGLYKFWSKKPEGNSHLKNVDIDGRIILILIFKGLNLQEVEWKVMDWIELTLDGDRWGGSSKCGNKLLGKCWVFLD